MFISLCYNETAFIKKRIVGKKVKKKILNKETYIAILILGIISFVIISPQLYKKSIILGSDVMFHFNRFYEMSKQINTGNFNYYQSLYGFNSSGRIINAFYGWDFAFVMGLLLSIVKTWTKFQIISSFACTLIAGISMYSLNRYVKLSSKVSIFSSILYMSSAAVAFYPISQAFNSWGAAFLPLLFIPAVKAINNPKEPINVAGLAIIVSVLLSVHMMTLIIGLMAIVPFYFYSLIKSEAKFYWIKQMILTIGLAALLSANSIIGFLDPYLTNNILQPFHLQKMSGDIVKFLPVRNDLHNIGLIYTVIFVFSISVILLNWKKSFLEEKFFIIIGGFFLLLSSGLVPWDELPKFVPALKTFQFPHRFDIVSYVLLILVFSIILEKMSIKKDTEFKTIVHSLTVILCFMSVMNINTFMNSQSWIWQGNDPAASGNNKSNLRVKNPELLRKAFKSSDLTEGLNAIVKGTPDYLPIPIKSNNESIYSDNPYEKYIEQFVDNPLKVKKTITSDSELKLEWASSSSVEKEVQLPIVIYNHSIVKINGQEVDTKRIKKTNLGALIVGNQKEKNEVVVGYHPILNIKIVFALKLVGIVLLIVYLFRKSCIDNDLIKK